MPLAIKRALRFAMDDLSRRLCLWLGKSVIKRQPPGMLVVVVAVVVVPAGRLTREQGELRSGKVRSVPRVDRREQVRPATRSRLEVPVLLLMLFLLTSTSKHCQLIIA